MKLNYGTVGYKGLSYSRREDFVKCPRKFEISHALGLSTKKDSVTFSFGHAIGAGIQAWFETGSLPISLAKATAHYSMDWDDAGTITESRDKKSLWYALEGVERFHYQMQNSIVGSLAFLKDYELLAFVHNDKLIKAIELEFIINLEYGFVYEGHVDLILRNKITGQFLVLEIKTTKTRDPHDAQYGNSDQALGYSIVLDTISSIIGSDAVPSYEVAYLIYSSTAQEWYLKRFTKTAKQRLNWLNNVMRDVELIHSYQMAAEQGIPYPTRGSACLDFFRPCEYYNLCAMENSSLLALKNSFKGESQFIEESRAHFVFELEQVINMQIALAEQRTGLELTKQTTTGDFFV